VPKALLATPAVIRSLDIYNLLAGVTVQK